MWMYLGWMFYLCVRDPALIFMRVILDSPAFLSNMCLFESSTRGLAAAFAWHMANKCSLVLTFSFDEHNVPNTSSIGLQILQKRVFLKVCDIFKLISFVWFISQTSRYVGQRISKSETKLPQLKGREVGRALGWCRKSVWMNCYQYPMRLYVTLL